MEEDEASKASSSFFNFAILFSISAICLGETVFSDIVDLKCGEWLGM
jgi:hypothetical protein